MFNGGLCVFQGYVFGLLRGTFPIGFFRNSSGNVFYRVFFYRLLKGVVFRVSAITSRGDFHLLVRQLLGLCGGTAKWGLRQVPRNGVSRSANYRYLTANSHLNGRGRFIVLRVVAPGHGMLQCSQQL